MRKLREIMEMYKWVLLIALVFILWAVIANFGTVLSMVFYPLYLGIVLGGLVIIKYQHRDIETLTKDILYKESIFGSALCIVLGIVYFWVYNTMTLSFEYRIILLLFMGLFIVNAIIKIKHFIKK